MEKSTKKLLKYLEEIFPQTIISTPLENVDKFNKILKYINNFDEKTFKILEKEELIKHVYYSMVGMPKGKSNKTRATMITSKGVEFLNGLRQKRTNTFLLILTILLSIIGIIQIIILITGPK